ncbi:MAG: type II toxin-antitoxin system RelE/ParE family toxin [Bacillota bacterium]|nr:type II toxin-antitoxin system RelE/ParE family toxin [Bacillota bacterium]MDD3298437.1 type II toxin-antitoxin system RelE/ParE family toxin [Bacillota bacterium]MDD3851645.1 type II toxin-antitoxin system RelE/ParE family toxin [Bacillota bacterium]
MNNKYQVHYLPSAQKDLKEIFDYVYAENQTAAKSLVNRFDEAISKLETFPDLGIVPRDKRLKSLQYRILIVDNYLVFYVVIENIVEIRRILHGKRKYDFLI